MSRWLTILVLGSTFVYDHPFAHHSRAEFRGDDVEIAGELTEVIWSNPHPTFRLRPSDGNGEEIEVQVYGGLGSLSETGVSATLFNVGDRVTIAGRFSSRRENLFLGTHALFANGLEAVLQYDAEPHWSGDRVGGLGMEVVDETILARAAAANKGLFRVWTRRSAASAVEAARAMNPAYTEAGLAARSEWDLTDNPITRCESAWMPQVMYQPVSRVFSDDGDRITLRITYLGGATRTIWIDEVPPEVDQSPSLMGTSVGRWEGNSLVVETSNISAPAFDSQGTLMSDQIHVRERFTVSDDQARLDYELVTTDPVAFEAPVVFRYEYLALEEEFAPALCSPSSQ
jgi:hypothetical protein